ncbi:MAG: hypothetical protein ACM3Q0_07795, partial [Bacteroidota bacterium]
LVQFMRIDRRSERLASDHADDEESGIIDAAGSTFVVLRAFPLTGAIGAGIFSMSALFCLQDYLSMTIYAENITNPDSLASFMAMVYAGQQAAELAFLALMGRLILERAGPLVRNCFSPSRRSPSWRLCRALGPCRSPRWSTPMPAPFPTPSSSR